MIGASFGEFNWWDCLLTFLFNDLGTAMSNEGSVSGCKWPGVQTRWGGCSQPLRVQNPDPV